MDYSPSSSSPSSSSPSSSSPPPPLSPTSSSIKFISTIVNDPPYTKIDLCELDGIKVIRKHTDNYRERNIFEKLVLHPHENIVSYYGSLDNYIFIEYIEGHTLQYYKDNGSLEYDELQNIFTQICFGIKHLHSLDIIHNDIKPENIMIIKNKNKYIAKIIDFGFSTYNPSTTLKKLNAGSPIYMSPELLFKREIYGHSGDIWSMGIMLYYLLIGEFPFCNEDDKIDDLKIGIERGLVNWPKCKDCRLMNLLEGMLNKDYATRLGIDSVIGLLETITTFEVKIKYNIHNAIDLSTYVFG